MTKEFEFQKLTSEVNFSTLKGRKVIFMENSETPRPPEDKGMGKNVLGGENPASSEASGVNETSEQRGEELQRNLARLGIGSEEFGDISEEERLMAQRAQQEFIRQAREGLRDNISPQEKLKKEEEKILSLGSREDLDKFLVSKDKNLLFYLLDAKRLIEKGDFAIEDERAKENFLNELNELIAMSKGDKSIVDVDDYKRRVSEIIHGKTDAAGKESLGLIDLCKKREPREMHGEMPKCLEDLAELIMSSEEDKWRKDGERALINEEGSVNTENLLAWFRDRIMWFHDFNPDSEINLFNQISVPTLYRTYSFSEMLDNKRYFLKRTKRLGEGEYEHHRSEEYEKLKDHLLYEVWLFNTSHNYDVKYRTVMGIESKVPEVLTEMYYTNVFTKDRNRLLKILKLPKIDQIEVGKIVKSKNGEQEGQGTVGRVVRRALLAYYYLPELVAEDDQLVNGGNMFEKSLGENGSLEFYASLVKQLGGEVLDTGSMGFRDARNILRERIADLLDKKYGHKFTQLNIFDDVNKDRTVLRLIRTALRDAIAKVEGLADKKGNPDENVIYGENWANTMIYWTGISAKNDTNAIGFDAWTKIMSAKDYRVRQAGARGIFGEMYNIYGLTRIGLNFWEGIKVRREGDRGFNCNVLEVLQGGQGNDINLDRGISDFDFQDNAQRQFAANHIRNAFSFFEFVMKKHGMNFDQFLSVDVFGRIIFDPGKADEVFDKLWSKGLRYTFDLPDFFWDHEVRGWWRDKDKDGEECVYFGSKKLRDLMFNEELNNMGMYDRERFKDQKSKLAARNVFAYLIAKELYAHRAFDSRYKRYSAEQIMVIESYLRGYPLEIEETEGHEVKIKDYFFSKEEWEHVTKISHTQYSKMFMENLALTGTQGAIGGAFSGIKHFIKELVKF